MKFSRLATRLAFACWWIAAAGHAAANGDSTYLALEALAPDGRQLTLTEPLRFERDVFSFEFESGTFHLLAPVGDRTVGAVFLGKGSYKLSPACEDERRHLAFVMGETGLETLTERFSTLVLFFADSTADELALLGEPRPGTIDSQAEAAVETYFRWQKKEIRTNLMLRLLSDLYDTPGIRSGVFYAVADGENLPLGLVVVDPQGVEASRLGDGGEDTALWVFDSVKGGPYYQCHARNDVEANRKPPFKSRIDARHYTVETEIGKDSKVSGTTTLDLTAMSPVRVVPLSLFPNLRVASVELRKDGETDWTPVAWVQKEESDYNDFLTEDSDTAVVLPEILPKGAAFSLRMRYAGDKVLDDRGGGTFAVGARTSWYPNAGIFKDTASFDLTYRVPAGNQVISVGQLQSAKTEGDREITIWKEESPIRVAGFNYGKFKKLERADDQVGIRLEVFTGAGTPDVIREINLFFSSRSRGDGSLVGSAPSDDSAIGGVQEGPSSIGKLNAEKIADSTLADGMNALRVGTAYFGPLPNQSVAITQQEAWNFGQSWPSLIFMPYTSYLTGTQRKDLGMGGGFTEFVDSVGYHEMAHQWWGHHVGWGSYRDQWISEGFAEFSSGLAVQHTAGWDKYLDFWKRHRDQIVGKAGSPVPLHEVGPITRGWRLSTHRAPGAGFMIYSKGAFVLHMLRMLMFEPAASDPDAAFIALMKDFTTTYAGKSPTTEDFKATVEKHMVPTLNATGNGKIDWFFDQWVYGTEVPRLSSDLKAKKLSGDEYQVTGTVRVAEVSDDFLVLVPLYAELSRGRLAGFGNLAFKGPGEKTVDVTIKLPEKPRRIFVNGKMEVLAKE
jgi:Peptidase family M1 domain